MRELPGGVVTFLFSDIEGSTRLVKALRERYAGVLAEHRRLVRTAVAAHAGYEVDTQGDAFFVAFGGAKQAVLCALDIQRALGAQVWPGGARVRVRIGIHTGQPVVAGGGYTGLAVHRAARICAVAAGGQVLISQATQDLIEDEEEAEPGFALVDVGEYRLKDLDRPVRLFQLTAAGLDLPAMAPSSRDAGAGVRGWRPPLTSFVGRDGPIRIMSLPCSTGEEPYSIALRLLAEWPLIDDVDVEIHAGDIDSAVLASARNGVYGSRSLQRVPLAWRERYFQPVDDDRYQVNRTIRDAVTFSKVNVCDTAQMSAYADFDAIFCRNVLIYFDPLSCRRAAENLYGALRPGGYLFLGHSESMSRISPIFNPVRLPEGIAYQRSTGAQS